MASKKKSGKKNNQKSNKAKNNNSKKQVVSNENNEIIKKIDELDEISNEKGSKNQDKSFKKEHTGEVTLITDEVLEKVEQINKQEEEEKLDVENHNEEIKEEKVEEPDESTKVVEVVKDEETEEPEKVKTHTGEVETIKEVQEREKQKEESKEKSVENDKTEKSLTTQKEKAPTYVEDPKKVVKAIKKFFIFIIVVALLALALSTGFAFLNINNTTIVNKTVVKDIDVSYMSEELARTNLKNELGNQLSKKIKFVNGEFSREFNTSDINFEYKIEEAVQESYNYTRKGTLVENNYAIIFAFLLGKDVELKYSYDEEALNKFVEDIALNIPGLVEHPSYYIEEDGLFINKGKDGIQVKQDELKKLILDNILTRNSNTQDNQILQIPIENKKADSINLDKILSEIKKDPKDAYYETEPDFKIYREENGVDFGVTMEEAKSIISNKENATVGEDGIEEYRVPLKITPANKTINDIGLEAFPYEIETFTTRYDETNYSRTNNLEIATEKINGTVLMPGEIFSYNQVVGKRTIEEGYQNAKIYENGQVVDGLAGGICQVSSTLYNVALLSNLEIVERHNHSFTTSYLPAGRDATVVYGVKDLQFKNTRNYPIKITGELESGILRFTMYGIKEDEEYDIKIIPTTIGTIPTSEKRVPDNSLAPGQTIVKQYGHSGSRVITRMQKYLDGELVYDEEISNDTYSPMQSIIHYGPEE